MMDRYIWHETIQTEHTRRSFLSEVAPDVLAKVRSMLEANQFVLPGGAECRVVWRVQHCLEVEVYTTLGNRLVRIGIAIVAGCGDALWERLGGAVGAQPSEPWCAASLDARGLETDPEAYLWLGDFERCLAWAWLMSTESSN